MPFIQGVGNPMGRGRAPWEGQEQGRGMGQGRLFRVVGWDGHTGTHLLLSVPGVEEDIPWEQYLQVPVRITEDAGLVDFEGPCALCWLLWGWSFPARA